MIKYVYDCVLGYMKARRPWAMSWQVGQANLVYFQLSDILSQWQETDQHRESLQVWFFGEVDFLMLVDFSYNLAHFSNTEKKEEQKW